MYIFSSCCIYNLFYTSVTNTSSCTRTILQNRCTFEGLTHWLNQWTRNILTLFIHLLKYLFVYMIFYLVSWLFIYLGDRLQLPGIYFSFSLSHRSSWTDCQSFLVSFLILVNLELCDQDLTHSLETPKDLSLKIVPEVVIRDACSRWHG